VSFLDFIARANPDYVESLYRQYKNDPASVDERWALVWSLPGRPRAGSADHVERRAP